MARGAAADHHYVTILPAYVVVVHVVEDGRNRCAPTTLVAVSGTPMPRHGSTLGTRMTGVPASADALTGRNGGACEGSADSGTATLTSAGSARIVSLIAEGTAQIGRRAAAYVGCWSGGGEFGNGGGAGSATFAPWWSLDQRVNRLETEGAGPGVGPKSRLAREPGSC